MEAMSVKIKDPTENFWTIFEEPVRNFDWVVTLPSVMQLQLERTCTFTSSHRGIRSSDPDLNLKIIPLVVNDCIFRIRIVVLGGRHEALVDINPLISSFRSGIWLLGLKVHGLAQDVGFASCEFVP